MIKIIFYESYLHKVVDKTVNFIHKKTFLTILKKIKNKLNKNFPHRN